MRVTAELVGDRQLVAKLEAMSDRVRQELLKAVSEQALLLEKHVKDDKLEGQVLKHKTGKLWQSIQSEVDDGADSVYGRVFSAGDIKYAALHEYGEDVRAHTRLLTQVFGRPLKFPVYATVKEFKMPERSFMRTALADREGEIVASLTAAVDRGVS